MGSKAKLTKDIIDHVWTMYTLGHSKESIALKLKISLISVQRCITAFEIAASGQKVEYTGLFRDSHHIADYANEKFKVEPVIDICNNTLEETILALAKAITRQTDLLESFIKKLEYRG